MNWQRWHKVWKGAPSNSHSLTAFDQDTEEATRLVNEEGDHYAQPARKPKWYSRWSLPLQVLLALAAIFGIVRLAGDIWGSAHATTKDISCYCGKSIPEARSLGCEFDPVAAAWLPQACRDDELTEQFNHAGPGPDGAWQYYTDSNKTDTYSLEEVAALADVNKVFWTTLRWHVVHCSYNWRKQWRRSVTGVKMEGRFDTLGHLAHCEKVFQKEGDLEEVITHSAVTLNADFVPNP